MPSGYVAIDEVSAPADVFFVHPTTYEGSPVWNAPFDPGRDREPLASAVLLNQLSVFNGCCRLYAPRYRQATLVALKEPRAMDLAYRDVARAFREYMDRYNAGRPFIIASHSQGTAHAIRLLQEEVLGTRRQSRLVAAFLVGGYVPDTFGGIGLPVCTADGQTGCLVSFNTGQRGRGGTRLITEERRYWWRGRLLREGPSRAVCVNPLAWGGGAAPKEANDGSMAFPEPSAGTDARRLPALTRHLTGAVCRDRTLEVDVPWSAPPGFVSALSLLLGSYHLNDYGMFYAALRRSAAIRVWEFARRERAATRSRRSVSNALGRTETDPSS